MKFKALKRDGVIWLGNGDLFFPTKTEEEFLRTAFSDFSAKSTMVSRIILRDTYRSLSEGDRKEVKI